MTDSPPPPTTARRRFKPELLETTESSTSTRVTDRSSQLSDVETTSIRRFAPELVTTSTRSSHAGPASQSPPQNTNIPKSSGQSSRRFAVQPVETSSRKVRPTAENQQSNQDREGDQPPLLPHERLTPALSRRKFAPMPVETTTRTYRAPAKPSIELTNTVPIAPHPSPAQVEATPPKPAKRKFAPQLLETASRIRKAGDTEPAMLLTDKTNVSPGDPVQLARPKPQPLPPTNTPSGSQYGFLRPLPNRQGSLHVHYNTPRQHSYRIPTLDVIESSESDEDGDDGSFRSRSNSASSADSLSAYKHATRQRESVDDRFSGYLLALAARAAEKQLREQEAAVFATTDLHEPVAHYANRDDSGSGEDDDDDKSRTRQDRYHRDSGDEIFELEELRRHGETSSKRKEADKPVPGRRKTAAFNVEFDGEAHQGVWGTAETPRNIGGGYQGDSDLKSMRKAAAPPMLGSEIDFPRCASPDHARFDVTQGADFLRQSMCYLTEQGMWDGKSKRPDFSSRDSISSKPKKMDSGGLWGGTCTQADARLCAPVSSGLMTPARTPGIVERDDPFSQFSSGASVGTSVAGKRPGPPQQAPVGYPSPPSSSSAVLDEALDHEKELDAEFGDAFITQVYNYLSLGYPALAQKFDDELSKISGVPVNELRSDDKFAEAHGYLRLGDAEPTCEDVGVQRTDCKRWLALRSYCREWGRQIVINRKEGQIEDPHRAWGLVRKGSWSN